MQRSTLNILIVGGGIGGLAAALALRQHGWQVSVYERAAAFQEVGSGVVLSPNGVRALDAISPDLGQAIRALGYPGDPAYRFPFLDPRGRATMVSEPEDSERRWGAPMLNVLRRDLQRVLLDAFRTQADDHALHTGARLIDVTQTEESVTAHFADGRTATGDLLIGADGVRSIVRERLISREPLRYLGVSSIRGLVAHPGTPFSDGFLTSGPGMQLFTVRLRDGRLYWAATPNAPEGMWPALAAAEVQARLVACVQGWHAPVSDMIAATPLADLVVTDIHDCPPLKTWTCGRVTLLGDAAHPLSPFMGQGANMALEDADTLARALSRAPDIATALAEYEQTRLPRTTRVAKVSRDIGLMGQWENTLAIWVRDLAMRLMSRAMNDPQQNRWLYEY